MISLLLVFLTIIISVIEIYTLKFFRDKKKVIEIFLLNSLLFLFGFNGLIGFLAHVFFGPQTARLIGWESGNPFQYEVGIANFAFGIIALLCLFFRHNFWLAAIIANTVWCWGNAIGHIRSMITTENFSPGNAGGFFYADICFPFIAIILFTLAWKKRAH